MSIREGRGRVVSEDNEEQIEPVEPDHPEALPDMPEGDVEHWEDTASQQLQQADICAEGGELAQA